MKSVLLFLLLLIGITANAQTAGNIIFKKVPDPFALAPLPGQPKPTAFKPVNWYPGYIKKLDSIFKSRHINYEISFTDSVKFKHPYLKNGEGLGVVTITNKKYTGCDLKYYVAQYTNKDSVSRDIFHFYSLRETSYHYDGPYQPVFYMDNYVFFVGMFPDLARMDDPIKYISLNIADGLSQYMKYQTIKK